MLDNDEFKIHLKVAGKAYPVFCKRSEEGTYRMAAKAIDDKVLRYGSRFAGAKLELSDLLVMTAIHISAENQLLKQKEDTSPLLEKIELLDKELEEYLQST